MRKNQLTLRIITTIVLIVLSITTGEGFAAGTSSSNSKFAFNDEWAKKLKAALEERDREQRHNNGIFRGYGSESDNESVINDGYDTVYTSDDNPSDTEWDTEWDTGGEDEDYNYRAQEKIVIAPVIESTQVVAVANQQADSTEIPKQDNSSSQESMNELGKKQNLALQDDDLFKTQHLNNQMTTQAHQLEASIEAAYAAFAMSHHMIKNRLLNTSLIPIAIAVGDEDNMGRTGIWINNGYSISKQGSLSDCLSYKSRVATMTIGGDIELGESTILGVAYSNAQAHLKFNSLNGKRRINSHILSIYFQHDLQSNFYLQLVGSAASSSIRSEVVGECNKKSYVDNISLESNLTYHHSFSNGMQLLPTIGLKYNYLCGRVDEGNKTAKQIIILNHKYGRILSSHFGTMVIFNPIKLSSSVQLTPTMHASLERRITNSCKIIMASITQGEGVKGDVRVELPRVVKNKYNVGVGVIAQNRNVKLQLDYNYSMQKFYKSHEAQIKLKITL